MTTCPRPLDPIDAEAVAAGAEPIYASDAAAHAAACAACGELVRGMQGDGLPGPLEGLSEPLPSFPGIEGLAGRVTRLRAFSSRERRTYALWRAPLLLDASLVAGGLALLALPVLTASEQVSVGAAALAPALALARSTAAWALDSLRVAPAGLEALSDGLRGHSALGLAALAILVPAGLALRRVLVRVPAERAPGRR
ncbi:MAG TPA: hypothetical protein VGH97_04815 [Thermoanaerobaculia bacterium]